MGHDGVLSLKVRHMKPKGMKSFVEASLNFRHTYTARKCDDGGIKGVLLSQFGESGTQIATSPSWEDGFLGIVLA